MKHIPFLDSDGRSIEYDLRSGETPLALAELESAVKGRVLTEEQKRLLGLARLFVKLLRGGLEEGESPRSVSREEAYERLPGLMGRFREFGRIPFTRPRSDDLQTPPMDSAGRSVAPQKVGIAVDLSAVPEDALGVFYLPFGTTAFVDEESFMAMLEMTGRPIPRGVNVRYVRDGNLQRALLEAIPRWSEHGIEGLWLFSTRSPYEVRQAIGEIQFPILFMDRHKTVWAILSALGADPNTVGTFIELYESSLGLSEYL